MPAGVTTRTLPSLFSTLMSVPAGMTSVSSAEAVCFTRKAEVNTGLRSTWTKLVTLLDGGLPDRRTLTSLFGIGEALQSGARVVEGQDLVEGDALAGRLPGAPLAHPYPVAPAAAGEDEVVPGCARSRSEDKAGEDERQKNEPRGQDPAAAPGPRTGTIIIQKQNLPVGVAALRSLGPDGCG